MVATANGTVKRTALEQFVNIRKTGLRAIELVDGDQLIDVRLTDDDMDVILAARSGKAIRFHATDARAMGRTARGVRGIELAGPDDAVVGMLTVSRGDDISTVLSVTEKGFGKRTPAAEYRVQNRGGKGIITMKTTRRNGGVVRIQRVTDGDELMVVTKRGIIIRMAVANISTMGRNTQGVKLINLDDGDTVSTVARLVTSDEEMEDGGATGDNDGK